MNIKHMKNLSKLDSVAQGDTYENIGSDVIYQVGDPIGRLHTINAPIITDEWYLRDSNNNISTMVTQIEGGRYFITIILRDSNENISTMDTTSSYWTDYV